MELCCIYIETDKFKQVVDFYEKVFQKKGKSANNIITLNFYSNHLKNDYERIKALKIGEVSDIMYVNITEPYYYFNIYDPERNVIEICGDTFDE